MSVLFKQNYDVIAGKEAEYGEFVSNVYLPEMEAIGFKVVGAYYVEIGFGPRVVGVHRAESLEDIARMMATKRFKNLTTAFKSFLCNYRNVILEPTGRVKKVEYTIQKGVWKLNLYYDLRPGLKEKYSDFIINEHIPVLEAIDYVEITGGWNVVIGGVSEIISELTFKDPVDIGRLLNNEEYRRVNLKLRDFVQNYACRIMRCTERFDEPKWFRL
ncbi:MAG: hypothetical protein N2745_06200 [Syntrophorhabdaceae bacterium]|nr:hypothetical protein [Syntrophorhabdaceae bacterium]